MIGFRDWIINEAKNNFNKKLIDQFGQYRVYIVDGESVRNSSPAAEEFGCSSIHAYLPTMIPEKEIWLEDDLDTAEQKILITSALYELKAIENGAFPDKAYDEGLKREKDYRESLRLSKKQPWKIDKPAPEKIYVKKYGYIDEGIDVWLVNGHKVRDDFKSDFIEGGNPWTYSWIPNDEIWIEKSRHAHEFPLIILHEFVEMTLMKYKKMTYDKAHEIASKVEFSHRGKRFSKKDALSLNKDKALSLVANIKHK